MATGGKATQEQMSFRKGGKWCCIQEEIGHLQIVTSALSNYFQGTWAIRLRLEVGVNQRRMDMVFILGAHLAS